MGKIKIQVEKKENLSEATIKRDDVRFDKIGGGINALLGRPNWDNDDIALSVGTFGSGTVPFVLKSNSMNKAMELIKKGDLDKGLAKEMRIAQLDWPRDEFLKRILPLCKKFESDIEKIAKGIEKDLEKEFAKLLKKVK